MRRKDIGFLAHLYSCCHGYPIEGVYVSLHAAATHEQLPDQHLLLLEQAGKEML